MKGTAWLLLSMRVDVATHPEGLQVERFDVHFEWLEHAWTAHDGGVTELLTNPFLRAYKDDPRFIAFAQKIGVMPKTAPKP